MKVRFIIIFWLVLLGFFFRPVFSGKVPAPLDTIVGLYHPWRDVIWDNYQSGVPFKNFLITDPVRQQIPWKYLAIENLKSGRFNTWNRFSFSGSPLTANIQASMFYPFNALFLIVDFVTAWSIFILSGPLLCGIFLILYLKNLKVSSIAAMLGACAFCFSGFFISWLSWGTIPHVLIWLPLILLATDKLIDTFTLRWFIIYLIALVCILLAGHLQLCFYALIFAVTYYIYGLFVRITSFALTINDKRVTRLRDCERPPATLCVAMRAGQDPVKNNAKLERIRKNHQKRLILNKIGILVILFILGGLIVSFQYVPMLKLLFLSARNFDLPDWRANSWFLPYQHLISLLAPDFFGNPATLNYWGVWNYGELTLYIGVIPLILAILALIKKTGKSQFFLFALAICFVFVLSNPLSKLVYYWQIPFFSTAQPTRLIFLITFCLSVLSAYGFDRYINEFRFNNTAKKICLFLILVILLCWCITVFNPFANQDIREKLTIVTRRNLVIPTVMLAGFLFINYFRTRFKKQFLLVILIALVFADLFRFTNKFLSFSNPGWFYPQTPLIKYLQEQPKPYRIMSVNREIFPSNFSIMYGIEEVGGYDPVYLTNYARLVSAWDRNLPNIQIPAYNRIITPTNYQSFIADLLNVKYVLSLSDINSAKLEQVGLFGQTRIYRNKSVFPRFYFVNDVKKAGSPQEVIEKMFLLGDKLRETAVIQEDIGLDRSNIDPSENIMIETLADNYIRLKVTAKYSRLLVSGEIYYPDWQVFIDHNKSKIYQANLALRAVLIPPGTHQVEFIYGN